MLRAVNYMRRVKNLQQEQEQEFVDITYNLGAIELPVEYTIEQMHEYFRRKDRLSALQLN